MVVSTHQLTIGDSNYLVHGSDTNSLVDICKVLDLKYDMITPTPIPDSQGILKIWKVGELKDYLQTKK